MRLLRRGGISEILLTLPALTELPVIPVSRDGSEMLLAEDEEMMSQVLLVGNLR